MNATTIKVPRATRDRVKRIAKQEALTLARVIDKLVDLYPSRRLPTIGGYRFGKNFTAEEIDAELRKGFGESEQ